MSAFSDMGNLELDIYSFKNDNSNMYEIRHYLTQGE
jgi:hypothetical protein